MEYQYAYLVGACLFGFIWLFLFMLRKDLRREILVVGLAIGIVAPLWALEFFIDYWHPIYAWFYGLEDFLYGFFAGGIVSAIYEEIYGKRFSKIKDRHHKWPLILAGFIVIAASTFFVLAQLGLNSLYAALGTYLVFALLLQVYRRDLVQDAFVGGTLFTVVTFFVYFVFLQLYPDIIEAWWRLENLSGFFVLGIPIEELLWAFGMGMAGGPIYEFVSGRRLVSR